MDFSGLSEAETYTKSSKKWRMPRFVSEFILCICGGGFGYAIIMGMFCGSEGQIGGEEMSSCFNSPHPYILLSVGALAMAAFQLIIIFNRDNDYY